MRLGDAFNTHNPALITLAEKGYRLWIQPSNEEAETEIGFWCASIDDTEFIAGDPLALLGLVAIWEHRGAEWKRSDDADLYDTLVEKAYPD